MQIKLTSTEVRVAVVGRLARPPDRTQSRDESRPSGTCTALGQQAGVRAQAARAAARRWRASEPPVVCPHSTTQRPATAFILQPTHHGPSGLWRGILPAALLHQEHVLQFQSPSMTSQGKMTGRAQPACHSFADPRTEPAGSRRSEGAGC